MYENVFIFFMGLDIKAGHRNLTPLALFLYGLWGIGMETEYASWWMLLFPMAYSQYWITVEWSNTTLFHFEAVMD